MRKLFRFLKLTFLGLIAFLLLTSIGLFIVLQKPNSWLNERTARWAAEKLSLTGRDIRWSNLKIHTESFGLLRKRTTIEATDLCVDTFRPQISGCFQEFKLSWIINLNQLRFRVEEIGPVKIRARKLEYSSTPDPTSNPSNQTDSETATNQGGLPNWIAGARIQSIDVSVGQWKFSAPGTALSGQTEIQNKINSGAHTNQYNLSGKLLFADRSQIQLNAHLVHDSDEPFTLEEVTEAQLNTRYKIQAQYQQAATSSGTRPRYDVQLIGNFEPGKVTSTLQGSAQGLSEGVRKISVQNCKLDLLQKNKSGQIELNCPVDIDISGVMNETRSVIKIPHHINVLVVSHLTSSSFPPTPASLIQGKLELRVPPFFHDLIHGEGSSTVDVSGVPERFPQGWKLDTQVGIHFRINEFEKLVQTLDETSYGIPAPFHSLKGRVETAIEGAGNLISWNLPFKMRTDLFSHEQRLRMDGDGGLQLKPTSHGLKPVLNLTVNLSDVRLILPRFDLTSMPRLFPDSRIQQAGIVAPEVKPDDFEYHVTLQTRPGHPLQLLSNLTDRWVPLNLNLKFSDSSPVEGKIEVEKFPVNLLHRKARVKKLNIELADPPGESKIDGLIQVEYTDYKITIKIMATLEKPTIKMFSDPPLPEKQLVSVLLFGHTTDSLDSDQVGSVADAAAAIANRAMDLFSLYVLATTPIERVGYDPVTQVVTAKIRVASGTSLNLATNAKEVTAVGVQKRLGKQWTVRTDVNNPTSGAAREASTFLEWNYRH